MEPHISVIIPIYNVEKYIERCVCSLFEQTLDEIEYIFVNDCSSDNSMSVLESVIKIYPNRKEQIRIITNKYNLGQAASRIRGMKEAHGEYIINCDSDDWVDLQMYEKLYQHAKQNDFDIVWCDLKRFKDGEVTNDSQLCSIDKIEIYKSFLKGNVLGSLCNRLIKRELFISNKIVYPVCNLREDLVLSFQVTHFAKKIGYLNEALYTYYCREDSITNEAHNRNRAFYAVNQFVKNFKIIESCIKDWGIYDKLNDEIILHKFNVKQRLLFFPMTIEDCKKWVDVFPEINWKMYANSYISMKDKLRSLLIILKVYPVLVNFLKNNP
jgi:glycosyltransferase involved in cell wall biosynthesis